MYVEVMLGAAVIRWCLSLNMANASFDAVVLPLVGSKYRFNLKKSIHVKNIFTQSMTVLHSKTLSD